MKTNDPTSIIHGFLISLLLLGASLLYCQKTTADSLSKLLPTITTLKDSVITIYEIGYSIVGDDNEKYQILSQQLKALGETRNYPLALILHHKLDRKYLLSRSKMVESLEAERKALSIAQKHGLQEEEANCFNGIGMVFYRLGQADSSLFYILQFTEIMDEIGNRDKVGAGYFNLAILAQELGQTKKAVDYQEKALQIKLEVAPESNLSTYYRGLGATYSYDKQFERAIPPFIKALEIAERFDDKLQKILTHDNMAINYMHLEQYEEAKKSYLKCYELGQTFDDPRTLTYTMEGLSRVFYHLGDYQESEKYARKCIYMADTLNILELSSLGYDALAYASAGAQQYDSAFHFFERHKILQDSFENIQNKDVYAELEVRFETQQKEKELMQKELELSKKTNLQNQILTGAILVILLLTALFQYLRNKTKIKQKEAEHALRLEHAEAEKLRELDQLKSTFFANISHEFRTPLTLIKTPLQDLIKGKLKGKPEKYFRIMNRNADRLMNLVNQLLDLSKLESGKMKLQVAEGDIGKFTRAIAYSFESLAMRKQIDFQVNISKQPITGFFDKDKLEKILTNLLSNAFKFTPEEGHISINADKINDSFIIEVSDNGMGIPESQLPHIFERFYQSGGTGEVQASSGIGLALTKELIELHHGQIGVESGEGKGTVFKVTLPVSKNKFSEDEILDEPQIDFVKNKKIAAAEINEPEKAIAPLAVLKNNKPSVLVVEDNEDVRTYIYDQLKEHFSLLEAENGKAGLDMALEHIPDLIISDVMMPEMDGTELCQNLKTNERTSHIPVIMLTAKAERSDRIEGLETGADDYLTKPFDAEELQVRMANLIEQRKRLREKFRSEGMFKPKDVAVTSVDEQFLKKVMEAIEENMEDEEFSVEDLAKSAAMSRSQLHRKIKALTDVSPSVFIRTLRLERGKQLLEKKAGNASEVAFMVGFNSSTYFATCFKDRFGVSPGGIKLGALGEKE